jgi:hypothetical protein
MSRPLSRGGHPSKNHATKGPIEWGSVHITNGNTAPPSATIQQHVVQALTRTVNDPSPGPQSIYADSPPPVKYAALGSRNSVSDVRGSQFRMPNLQQTACASCEEMAKQLKSLKAKLDQMRQGRQDIERLAHVRVRESESALADLLLENNMLRDALSKHQSGSADSADAEKERMEREELERLKKQLHAAEQEIQYYKEEFERWRRQAASVEDRLVATSSALQERTFAAQKLEERVLALESELSLLRAAAASAPPPPVAKDLSHDLAAAISQRDAALSRASSLEAEVEDLKRALSNQKLESEAAAEAAKLESERLRAQLESDLVASRKECADIKSAADAAAASAEASLKIAKGQRDELESDLKDAKRVAQVTCTPHTHVVAAACNRLRSSPVLRNCNSSADDSRAANGHNSAAGTRA